MRMELHVEPRRIRFDQSPPLRCSYAITVCVFHLAILLGGAGISTAQTPNHSSFYGRFDSVRTSLAARDPGNQNLFRFTSESELNPANQPRQFDSGAIVAQELEQLPTPTDIDPLALNDDVEINDHLNEVPSHSDLINEPIPEQPQQATSDCIEPYATPSVAEAHRVPPANSSGECESMMGEYRAIVDRNPSRGKWFDDDGNRLPDGYTTWWDSPVRKPLNAGSDPIYVDIASLCVSALQNSVYVKAITAAPQIQHQELVKENAEFDWRVFLQSTYDDVNEPIGSRLTTGNNDDRFKDKQWSMDGGARRRNRLGGNVEIFQRFGTQDNNSTFLVPNPQRTSRLEMRFTQPLMRGAGRTYNESQIVLARIQHDMTTDELAGELQKHLVKVTETYWELYRARAEFLQRAKLLASAQKILVRLSERQQVDAIRRQIFRVETSVAQRKSDMIKSAASIRDLEARLRLLVNDHALVHSAGREYAPTDIPAMWKMPLNMSNFLHTALSNRPDISAAIRSVRAKSVELGVAKKDVLPRLDLLASGYAAGLASRSDFGKPFGHQFADGRPAFSLGFEYERPVGNRFANANVRVRRLEMAREVNRFHLAVQQGLTDVETAVRKVETSYREIVARHESLSAAEREVSYLEDRWNLLPGREDSASLLLENLLDAQTYVANEERLMVRAQVEYALALVQLKQEMGTLLQMDCSDESTTVPIAELEPPVATGHSDLPVVVPNHVAD